MAASITGSAQLVKQLPVARAGAVRSTPRLRRDDGTPGHRSAHDLGRHGPSLSFGLGVQRVCGARASRLRAGTRADFLRSDEGDSRPACSCAPRGCSRPARTPAPKRRERRVRDAAVERAHGTFSANAPWSSRGSPVSICARRALEGAAEQAADDQGRARAAGAAAPSHRQRRRDVLVWHNSSNSAPSPSPARAIFRRPRIATRSRFFVAAAQQAHALLTGCARRQPMKRMMGTQKRPASGAATSDGLTHPGA